MDRDRDGMGGRRGRTRTHHAGGEREDPGLGVRELVGERAAHEAEQRGRRGEELGDRRAPNAHAGAHEHRELAQLVRHLLRDGRHRQAHAGARRAREARADRQSVHLRENTHSNSHNTDIGSLHNDTNHPIAYKRV